MIGSKTLLLSKITGKCIYLVWCRLARQREINGWMIGTKTLLLSKITGGDVDLMCLYSVVKMYLLSVVPPCETERDQWMYDWDQNTPAVVNYWRISCIVLWKYVYLVLCCLARQREMNGYIHLFLRDFNGYIYLFLNISRDILYIYVYISGTYTGVSTGTRGHKTVQIQYTDRCSRSCIDIEQHTATHRNTLQHYTDRWSRSWSCVYIEQHTAAHCNTLQHTATHCNTIQIDVRDHVSI